MTGKTHVTCSTATMAVFALAHKSGYQFFGVDILPWVGVISASVGALLPDIDIPQSRLGQKFKFLSKNMKHRGITHTLLAPTILLLGTLSIKTRNACIVASLLVGLLVGMMFDARVDLRKGNMFVKLKNIIVNKKGLTSTVVLLVLTFIAPATGASILWGLMCGWTLHIFEDLFNSKGCPILYPFSRGHIHIASFKTRHWSEGLFFLLWTGGTIIWALIVIKTQL